MNRFSPLVAYAIWGAILVGSLVVDHWHAPANAACVRVAPAPAPHAEAGDPID